MTKVLLLVAALVLLAGACSDDDDYGSSTKGDASTTSPSANTPGGAAASLTKVDVADNSFTPSNLTVPKGTKVTWTWSGKNSHSVKGQWQGSGVESPTQKAGNFEFTFDKEGTFNYECGVHGSAMSGAVTVKP